MRFEVRFVGRCDNPAPLLNPQSIQTYGLDLRSQMVIDEDRYNLYNNQVSRLQQLFGMF